MNLWVLHKAGNLTSSVNTRLSRRTCSTEIFTGYKGYTVFNSMTANAALGMMNKNVAIVYLKASSSTFLKGMKKHAILRTVIPQIIWVLHSHLRQSLF
jgi:hypothetical protein